VSFRGGSTGNSLKHQPFLLTIQTQSLVSKSLRTTMTSSCWKNTTDTRTSRQLLHCPLGIVAKTKRYCQARSTKERKTWNSGLKRRVDRLETTKSSTWMSGNCAMKECTYQQTSTTDSPHAPDNQLTLWKLLQRWMACQSRKLSLWSSTSRSSTCEFNSCVQLL